MGRLRAYAPWVFPLLLPIAILVGVRWGPGAGVLVAASATLAAALLMLYRSVSALLDGAGAGPMEVALDEGEGSDLVHEKTAVLRALKDLEYEREVGKVTAQDFEALTKQYRARAVEILARIDKDIAPWRKKAEAAIQKRIDKGEIEPEAPAPTGATVRCPNCTADVAADSVFCKRCGTSFSPSLCRGCGTVNDPDSVFCKKCGRKIANA